SSDWVVHNGHYSILEPFVRDTRRLAAEVRKYGEYVVDAISFSQSLPVADDLRRADIALRRLHGTLILSQAHFNSIQEARWLEDTGYHYMPFFDGFGTRSFFAMLRERHGLELDWQDWTSALVHMAIPFAESRVIVVAPDNHAISPEVLAAGQARGVEIAAIPLSCFPAEQLRRLSHQHFVRPVDNTGQRFPKYAEQAIGESQDLNRELVPPHLLNYGLN
ncbi:MAG: hypothetical protein KAY24_08095, partial [Candidatus Eisenbacteria sp.]|nr:hypothetical protein [Candidatus Eisenbacteria bacterium]